MHLDGDQTRHFWAAASAGGDWFRVLGVVIDTTVDEPARRRGIPFGAVGGFLQPDRHGQTGAAINLMPNGSKCLRFRVTTVKSWALAVPAIRASAIPGLWPAAIASASS